jgi:tetratricopeptide (TPR) repeat protein
MGEADHENEGPVEENEDPVEEAYLAAYQKKDYAKAKRVVQQAIDEILPHYPANEEKEFHNARSLMEIVLFNYHFAPKKEVVIIEEPIASYYRMYGSVLMDENNFPLARGCFARGLEWDPVDFTIFSEYAETFKMQGEMDSFEHLTRMAYKYAYTSEMLARVYRNLGYCFTEKGLYVASSACYQLSLAYEPHNKNALNELEYIASKMELELKPLSNDRLHEVAKKHDIPLGADDDVLGLSRYLGEKSLKEGEKDKARYYYEVLYDLTGSADVKTILEQIDAAQKDDGKSRKN